MLSPWSAARSPPCQSSSPRKSTISAVSRSGASCPRCRRAASGRSCSSTISARRCLSGAQPVAVRPHPHIGLATVTYLWEGAMMHRDSLGSVQEIQPGDVNWMTAGRGIVHSERTPERLKQHRPCLPRPADLGRPAARTRGHRTDVCPSSQGPPADHRWRWRAHDRGRRPRVRRALAGRGAAPDTVRVHRPGRWRGAGGSRPNMPSARLFPVAGELSPGRRADDQCPPRRCSMPWQPAAAAFRRGVRG